MDYEDYLNKKLAELFPENTERDKADKILNAYGLESYEREQFRVRLAVLKLSGADLAEIEKMTGCAKQDYRDILSWAEYPRQSKKAPARDGSSDSSLVEADKQEYQNWLNSTHLNLH